MTIQTMVETEAQKEFMRYAFLKEPKTPIGKLVAGAWRKFKEWWDMHKRKEVEEKTRESVLGRLAELKKLQNSHGNRWLRKSREDRNWIRVLP